MNVARLALLFSMTLVAGLGADPSKVGGPPGGAGGRPPHSPPGGRPGGGNGGGYGHWHRPCYPGWGWGYSPIFVSDLGYGYYGGYGVSYGAYDQLTYQNNLLWEINRNLAQQQQQAANPPVRVDLDVRRRNLAAKEAELRDGARKEKAKQTTKSGLKLFNDGEYRRAAERFREAIELTEDDATQHFYLAQALVAARKYTEAAQAIKNGLKLSPDWIELDFDFRTLYGDQNALKAQLGHLAAELRGNPLDRDNLFVLGFELFVSGRKDAARTMLEQAVRVDRDDAHLKPFFEFYRKRDGG